MRDRQPTRPGRVKITPENGEAYYATMEMADEPTEFGTPPTKANLLTDETEAALFGTAADRTVDQAFRGVANKINLIMSDMATMTLTVKSKAGNPVPGVLVTGMFSDSGSDVYTNASGVASGYVSEGSVTLKISGYADIDDYSETISVTKGASYTKTISVTVRDFLKLTSSKDVKFSGNVNRVDVTVVGGGGGAGGAGAYGNEASEAASGGGGGGGAVVVQETVTFENHKTYTASIGAGGTNGTSYINSSGTSGGAGGTTTFMGLSATGGGGGGGAISGRVSSSKNMTEGAAGVGVGGGNGGTGVWSGSVSGSGTQAKNGNAGSNGKAGYGSFTETVLYGAGGGSGSSGEGECTGGAGGNYGGGAGGSIGGRGTSSNYNGVAGTAGTGSGGGSSAYYASTSADEWSFGTSAKGGSGCVAIRMHLTAT